MVDGIGKVAVITGASSGIGKAAARQLLEQGWRVIGTGRDAGRSSAAQRELEAFAGKDRFTMVRGDFTIMAEVSRVADEISGLTDRIDYLVNNAGGVRNAIIMTPDGSEATFAANHLASFLLTRKLIPLLEKAASSSPEGAVRVVAVSSSAHRHTKGLDFDDLQSMNNVPAGEAYCRVKLANILFIRELGRRVRDKGIVAQAMHPGIVASNFASHGDAQMQAHFETSNDVVSPDIPAQTLVWMATAEEAGLPSGRYFYNKAEEEVAPVACDDAAASRLWMETEKLLDMYGFAP